VRFAEPAKRRSPFVLPHFGQRKTLLAVPVMNSWSTVIGQRYRAICALGSGILHSNEANVGCLDVSNQLIDFRLRLRIQPQRDRSSEQQRED
jgi:hypothetical protein